ncbi:MAG: hypothetical protein H0V76_01800 [Blastocatellia bacterium]|nr:hypothetical protein [Blastocatellia bacterium]
MKLKLLTLVPLVGLLLSCSSLFNPTKPAPDTIPAAVNTFAKQNDPGNTLEIVGVESSSSGRLITLDLSHKGFRFKDKAGEVVNIPPGEGSASIFNRDGNGCSREWS